MQDGAQPLKIKNFSPQGCPNSPFCPATIRRVSETAGLCTAGAEQLPVKNLPEESIGLWGVRLYEATRT
jgi:hypothetical protein